LAAGAGGAAGAGADGAHAATSAPVETTVVSFKKSRRVKFFLLSMCSLLEMMILNDEE
jgi:hypothetical protein